MLFPTIDFAIFFAVAFTVNWLLNPYSGWWKLSMIGLSYVFYGWVGWSYCLLLLGHDGGCLRRGHLGGGRPQRASRRIAMGVSVGALLAILGWFKYYGFVSVNLDNLTHAVGLGRAVPLLQVGLPIAISFFTFMAISYVVDIYRRDLEPAKPLDYAVYISFFPHLLAGPIVRGGELLPQIRRRRDPNSVDYSRAFWLILAGLFKKVVISSYVSSAIVTPVFTSPTPALRARGDLRRLGLRGADLLRLQRLHRHRHRPRHAARVPVPAELRRALHGAEPAGLLAALAHDALALAARLPLHPPGRERQRPGPDHSQHHDHHGAGRPLARRGLDVRGLGRPAGAWARASGTCAAPAGSGGVCPGVADGPVRVWVQRFLTFQYVCLGWVFFNATGMSQAFALIGRVFSGWGEASPLVTPLLVVVVLGTIALQFVPTMSVDRLQAAFSRQKAAVQVGLLGVALLGITTFGPVGVAPFIYYRF